MIGLQLKEMGLSVVQTKQNPERSRHKGEMRADQEERPTIESIVKEDIDCCIEAADTFEEWLYLMRNKGYRMSVTEQIGRIEEQIKRVQRNLRSEKGILARMGEMDEKERKAEKLSGGKAHQNSAGYKNKLEEDVLTKQVSENMRRIR